MNHKHLHIVSFDVPFPADYGGVIDVFYRLKALHELGVKITLHCFEYGRGKQKELEQFAETVHYYSRKKTVIDNLSKKPFIVKSRDSKELIENLLKDKSPILFEGLHTTYYLADSRLKDRIKIVRTHNIEHDYYQGLALKAKGLKKKYFEREAVKLESYESALEHADYILAIKNSEKKHFEKYAVPTFVLPASSDWIYTKEKKETLPYFLFQGNLSVSENELGAKWLIENVFSPLNLCSQFKIAGKNPSELMHEVCAKNGVELIANLSDSEMHKTIDQARVHVFHTDQSTGVKLKLLRALSTSGHVLVNEKMVEGTNLSDVCDVAKTPADFQRMAILKIENEMDASSFETRLRFMENNFNTLENTKQLLDLL